MQIGLKIEVTACYGKGPVRMVQIRRFIAKALFGWETTRSRVSENSPSLSESDELSVDLSPNLLGHKNDA